jgi:hypothetical protein
LGPARDRWQALKSGADAMIAEPRQSTPRPILSSISAQLFVADIKSSCDFYTGKLGFEVEFIYGDPPFYGQVVRDNARLALRVVPEPVFAGDVRKREHLLSASITVATANEIQQLFLSYQPPITRRSHCGDNLEMTDRLNPTPRHHWQK